MAPAPRAFSLHVAILPLLYMFASVATSLGSACQPEIVITTPFSRIKQLTNIHGTLFFVFEYFGAGMNKSYLFKTNGFPSGTSLVKDIYPGGDANLGELTEVDGTLFFVGTDATHMRELWRSDGTAEGTVLVKDIDPVGSSSPSYLVNVNDTLFFSARDESFTPGLWKSDGTTAGTVLVRSVLPDDFSPTNLTNVNGTLFFSANSLLEYASGREVWQSDGTWVGTHLVKDINPGTGSSNPSDLTAIGSNLFFVADDGTHGRELWRSNGTEAGTALVADIRLGAVGSDPAYITQNGITVLFSATKEWYGRELWISLLGLTASQLKNINPENPEWADSNPAYLTKCGEIVFFAATKSDDATARELWKTDGTEAGTVMVKNINPTPGASSNPMELTCVNGRVYFNANDGVHGAELWVSDGTEAGTTIVKDLDLSGGSSPAQFLNANGILYFTTGSSTLWKCEEEFPWELFLPAFIPRH